MWLGAIWTFLLAVCVAVAIPDRVATLTQQFVDASKIPGPNLKDFYDADAVLSIDNALGLGGQFKGPEGVQLFLYRLFQAIVEQPPQIDVIGVDEARGTALIKMDVNGQFVRTGKNFKTVVLHALEWNQVTGKIVTHVVLDVNPSETLTAYQTAAEAHLDKLLWTLFRSSYEDLQDINSPVWNLISDNIQIKVNAYPELHDKMEWKGKPEVLRGFKDMADLQRNMPIYKEMMTKTNLIDAKVLLSNNSDVWVRWGTLENDKIVTHVIVHYCFDEAGKLAKEEITLAQAARPWQIYPFPAPKEPSVDASQIRKLIEVRGKVGLDQRLFPLGIQPISFADLTQTPDKKPSEVSEEKKKHEIQEQEGKDKDKKINDEEKSKDSNNESEGEKPKLDELELRMPIKVHVDGDVNTRIWGSGLEKQNKLLPNERRANTAVPPIELEVHGDMKTSIVTFGSGKVDTVKFAGSIDDFDVDKSKVFFSTDALPKSLKDVPTRARV